MAAAVVAADEDGVPLLPAAAAAAAANSGCDGAGVVAGMVSIGNGAETGGGPSVGGDCVAPEFKNENADDGEAVDKAPVSPLGGDALLIKEKLLAPPPAANGVSVEGLGFSGTSKPANPSAASASETTLRPSNIAGALWRCALWCLFSALSLITRRAKGGRCAEALVQLSAPGRGKPNFGYQ